MEIKKYGPLPKFDGGNLEEHLWLKIFLKSSIASVTRFRAVSKTWDAFLRHKNFTKLYNRAAFLEEGEDLIIVSGSVSGDNRGSLMSVRKTSFCSYDLRLTRFPVCAAKMLLVGSSAGLLCLSDDPEKMERMVVWNPCTAEEKVIRVPPTEERKLSTGIGHADVNDHKIVRLIGLDDSRVNSLVQIYSLNDDLWKDSITIPFYADRPASSFNIGGIPYWVGYDTRMKQVICSLDPASEVYEKIEYPPEIPVGSVYPVNLRDKVSALVACENKMIEIYCFQESSYTWVKKITTGKLHIELDWVRILKCYRGSGDVLAFGWPDSKLTINDVAKDVAKDGAVAHLSMRIGSDIFKPELSTGLFTHTGTSKVKIPGGKKVLESHPRPDGKFWITKRTKVNEVVVDVIEAFNGRSIGSYSEIALVSLVHLFRNNKEVSELALEELVHLSKQSDLAAKMVHMDMVGNAMEMLCLEGVAFTKLLVKLLVNLTRLDDGVEVLLKIFNSMLSFINHEDSCQNSLPAPKSDAFEDAGSILVNISKSDAGRKFLLEPERGLIKQILKEFVSASPVRRKGVSGTIRNCCFGLEVEQQLENLLMASEFLWTSLLLPIAGTKAYREEETAKMPPALGSTLLVEREAVNDPEYQIEVLEAVYLVALQERGRRALRSVNGKLIVEVGAACEQNQEVLEAFARVGSLGSDIENTSTQTQV
ncbi:hypothetical protein AG4045_018231 [Apium graveolens]|uniref:Uncharacterized protein n=1 Tax=Apium graveolens TaxID=4045 RepID=A0A6L5B8A3_APIGR|nr:hypothetical protein AG4045_018231 [Apium graveolens]